MPVTLALPLKGATLESLRYLIRFRIFDGSKLVGKDMLEEGCLTWGYCCDEVTLAHFFRTYVRKKCNRRGRAKKAFTGKFICLLE